MAECNRGCGAKVVTARSIDDRELILDREPSTNGNWLLMGRGSRQLPLAVSAGTDPSWIERWVGADLLYEPHMATCPKVGVPVDGD